MEQETMHCQTCGSANLVKNGIQKNRYCEKQKYICKECKTGFVYSNFKKAKFDVTLTAECIELWYRGLSTRQISDFLFKTRKIKVSHVTILTYLKKGVEQVRKFTDVLTPQLGRTWCVDETMVACRDQPHNKAWFWSMMDEQTRFLLAVKTSPTRTQKDCDELFAKALSVSGKQPKEITSDGLYAYVNSKKKYFRNAYHNRDFSFKKNPTNNLIESYHSGTVKQRLKPMRGFSKFNSSQILLDGLAIHHNYIRKHSSLNSTPAKKAEIGLPESCSWIDLLQLSDESKVKVIQ